MVTSLRGFVSVFFSCCISVFFSCCISVFFSCCISVFFSCCISVFFSCCISVFFSCCISVFFSCCCAVFNLREKKEDNDTYFMRRCELPVYHHFKKELLCISLIPKDLVHGFCFFPSFFLFVCLFWTRWSTTSVTGPNTPHNHFTEMLAPGNIFLSARGGVKVGRGEWGRGELRFR